MRKLLSLSPSDRGEHYVGVSKVIRCKVVTTQEQAPVDHAGRLVAGNRAENESGYENVIRGKVVSASGAFFQNGYREVFQIDVVAGDPLGVANMDSYTATRRSYNQNLHLAKENIVDNLVAVIRSMKFR